VGIQRTWGKQSIYFSFRIVDNLLLRRFSLRYLRCNSTSGGSHCTQHCDSTETALKLVNLHCKCLQTADSEKLSVTSLVAILSNLVSSKQLFFVKISLIN